MTEIEKTWTKIASDQLLGRTIKKVRYLSEEEMNDLGWYSRCVVLELDDGTVVYPSQDDEGNNAGSLFTNSMTNGTLPII